MRRVLCLCGIVLICQAAFIAAEVVAQNDLPSILGVFGIDCVPENTAFAVWVPLEAEASISGVQWYNNDGGVTIPCISAVAGEYGRPDRLALATVVAENVVGASSGWSTCTFSQPIAAESGGLYVIFEIPVGSDFTGEGFDGGAGVGYIENDQENRCWITGDGENWDALAASRQMAIVPVPNLNKSGEVLVLTRPESGAADLQVSIGEPVADIPAPQNWIRVLPNPFNPSTEVRLQIPVNGHVDVGVYDVKGRMVRRLSSGYRSEGEHRVTWDGRSEGGGTVASGVYLIRLRTRIGQQSARVTLLQ